MDSSASRDRSEEPSDYLEFAGEGSEECNKFIAAVMKCARAQGKLRDNEWITDLVSTCLTGEALRWWIELDEETQGSWNLLRRAMVQEYQPLFQGCSGEEAEKFIQMIHRRARAAGKEEDNKWIMKLVPSCLSGEALRWYTSLDSSIRKDWDSFQQATFARYPRKDGAQSSASSISIVPTPAAAGAVPSTEPARQKGRIRLELDKDASSKHYISKNMNSAGFFTISRSLNDALQVEYDRNAQGLKVFYLPQNHIKGFDAIGFAWKDDNFSNRTGLAAVCAVNSQTGKFTGYPETWKGPFGAKIWRLAEEQANSKEYPLSMVFQNGDLFAFSSDKSPYTIHLHTDPAYNKVNSYTRAKFTFEAC